jgi:hypothetical protein
MYRALCHILQQQHQVHHSSPLPSIRPLQVEGTETAAREGEERMPESKMPIGQKVAQPKSAASKKSEKSAQSKEKPLEQQQQQQQQQQTFLCNVRDLAKNG